MANTYTLIASNTVGSGGASSVTFSSIPATYTDLIVKVSSRHTYSQVWDWFSIAFNGSSSGYSIILFWTDSSTPASYAGNNQSNMTITEGGDGASATTNTFGNTEIYIPNYTSSNYKSVSADAVNENSATSAGKGFTAGLWSNTSTITSIQITPSNSGNFVQYSSFYLYGINNS